VDKVPPDVTCPDTVVVEKYNTIYNRTNITISNVARAWDLSGLFGNQITYKLSLSSSDGTVPLRHFVNITARAFDFYGNSGSCHFLYEAKSELNFLLVILSNV
jgi:hypothetical protein